MWPVKLFYNDRTSKGGLTKNVVMKTFLNVPSKVKPSLLKESKSTGCCEPLIISLFHFLL